MNHSNRVIEETLRHLQETCPVDFQYMKSNSAVKEATIKAAEQCATYHFSLDEHIQANSSTDPVDVLEKNLPSDHLERVKTGLQTSTHHLNISKDDDGNHTAEVIHSSSGDKLMSEKKLNTVTSISETFCIGVAHVITDVTALLLQVCGVKIAVPSKEELMKMANELVPVVNEVNEGLIRAISGLVNGAKKGSSHEIAHALYEFIKEVHPLGVLVKIAKTFCQDMSIEGGLKAGAMITATIIAAILSDGRVLIPKIKMALHSAWDFMKKVKNLHHLKTLESEVKQNKQQ